MLAVATEDSVASSIGTIMSGGASAPTEEKPTSKYEFDLDFQERIATLVLTDKDFNRSTDGLIDPSYFENDTHAKLVDLGLGYFKRFGTAPTDVALKRIVEKAIEKKIVRPDMVSDINSFIEQLPSKKKGIGEKMFVVDEVAEFARYQAMAGAALQLIEMLEKRNFDKALDVVKKASMVGSHGESEPYDYFAEAESRSTQRKAELAGLTPPTGITTGMPDLDKHLYHKGWGRKEMTLLMGGPKSGKSTAMADFGKFAALAGYNVYYATLEVSKDILSDRVDANIADIIVSEVKTNPNRVAERVTEASEKAGKYIFEEFPSGSMKPQDLDRTIQRFKADGLIFDLVIVDYADLMAPNHRTNDTTENSKSIYVDLRAGAQREGYALLTATQTNREGAKSAVSRMEHVAEDFNKIRTADLVISINATEDEKREGVARLFFVASRNQRGGWTLKIKQNQERMKFITEVIGEE